MWQRYFFSFPVQLFILHLRKNLVFVGVWVLLIFIVSENFGKLLGIPYLFLDPEYLNEVSWTGFFLMGVGIAVFTMTFHMTTYIIDGSRFKFLAVTNKPFLHYCLNNFIFPLIFYLVYLVAFIHFQLDNELENQWMVLGFFGSFAIGSLLTYLLLFSYFNFANKDFFVLFADGLDKRLKKIRWPRANLLQRVKEDRKLKNQVAYYLGINFKLKRARPDLARFDRDKLLKVFDQNHLNLFIIQVFLMGFVVLMGIFKEQEWLQLPAAVSAMLLFSIFNMILGAIGFWLRNWTALVLISLMIILNLISQTSFFNRPHMAYGLDYLAPPAIYDLKKVDALLHEDTLQKDLNHGRAILDNWKKRTSLDKPKMVLLASSGGGQRAALWTLRVLQEAYMLTDGAFFRHCKLITGASGGVIGAAFFREIYLRSLHNKEIDPVDKIYLQQLSSDNLNPIIFTLLVNDLFIRNQYFKYNERDYLMDRGGAFENQLNKNTKGVLDKPLQAYLRPEWEGVIPQMPITPLVVNDARKLYISPHSMSYMCASEGGVNLPGEKGQGIDFKRFFINQDALQLRFSSALRMGATFPFITPNVQLPSFPEMETMDAGLADNFGIQDAHRFMFTFRDWIAENTSGVVLMTVRDSEKILEIEHKPPLSILEKLMTPLKNIYINWDNVQTLNNETLYHFMKETLPFHLERVEFEYSTKDFLDDRKPLFDTREGRGPRDLEVARASLNWRLTSREKRSILNNIYLENNQKSFQRLREIFLPSNPY
ncbi:MAG: patatin-like phospholipase family protein [Cyclobacteriaceae bacterium]